MQEELYKMKTQRDVLQAKVETQEKQLEDAMAKESRLQVALLKLLQGGPSPGKPGLC